MRRDITARLGRSVAWCLRASIVAGCVAVRTVAQEAPVDPDLDTRGMRTLGPLHLLPSLVLRDVGYDDNVLIHETEAQSDYTATIAPGLKALVLTGNRGGVLVAGEAARVTYLENDELDHWEPSARARGILVLRRLLFSLEERYESSRERTNIEIDVRDTREHNAVTAEMKTLGAGRLGVTTTLRTARSDYSSEDPYQDEAVSRLDRVEDSLAIRGDIRILPKTTLTLDGTLGNADFRVDSFSRDSRLRSFLPGLKFDPSASLQGEIRGGLARVAPIHRPADDFDTGVWDGRISSRLGSSGRGTVTLGRSLVFSTDEENLFYINTKWGLAYERFFSRRASAELSYGRGLNEYPEPVAAAGTGSPAVHRDDHVISYQAQLRCRVQPQLVVTATAQRYVQDSNIPGLDRDRNIFMIGTTYEF